MLQHPLALNRRVLSGNLWAARAAPDGVGARIMPPDDFR